MTHKTTAEEFSMPRFLLVLSACLLFSCGTSRPPQAVAPPVVHADDDGDGHLHEHQTQETVTSMSGSHDHLGPHFRWTGLRPSNPADQEKAAAIVRELRRTLDPYRDYRVAIKDGFEPFLPNVQQEHYHFTSKWRGFKSAFRFNPAEPTSLLYRKTANGYELEGAMYTAPKRANETDLNGRIPLSVGQWHAHVNICLPAKKEMKTADWTKFGPKGSILTEAECDQANGRFVPQLFGWMLHVHPFAAIPEKIWTH